MHDKKDDIVPLPDSKIFESMGLPKGSLVKGEELAIALQKQFILHKKSISRKVMYADIKLLLDLRHKIIHHNVSIKIDQDDLIRLTLAIYGFVISLENIYQEMVNSKKLNTAS
jgi:hypothetical protein